jgi:hypothetical protein
MPLQTRPSRRFLSAGSLALALVLAAPAAARAQQGPGGNPPCAAPEYRQFDFWVGAWEVRNPAGDVVGENRIRPILGGCALLEEWSGSSGSAGKSVNMYDASTGRWHQTWVGGRGMLLLLDGGLDGDAMVLRGSRSAPDGGEVVDEIRWEPLEGGDVRQLWRTSRDGGKSWQTAFDGRYSPVAP